MLIYIFFLENYVINSAKLIEKSESNSEDNMGFKSYYQSIRTTSFRVNQLYYKNECQLRYLNGLFTSNPDMEWNKALQSKYLDLFISKDFIDDYDASYSKIEMVNIEY